jgi:phage terminase large subunit
LTVVNPPAAPAARLRLPAKLVPVFSGPAMYRGAHGGRGSGKTRSFAKMAAVHGLRCAEAGESGVIVCGREYQNSLADSSMAEVKAAIESEEWLREAYEIGENFIRTRDGRVAFTFIGLRRNIASVKSTSSIRLLWVDEAEPVSETSWSIAIPTVREDNAEIWVTWNPERKNSATNLRFRADPPADTKIVEMNWRDNPWFPERLAKTREEDEAKRPDQYEHVWEGAYITAQAGAYYARHLSEAAREGRIGKVALDPLMAVRAFWDIGGTGARADACAIWVAQFVGREIRVLDYYEAVGEPLGSHLAWLRERGWGKAACVLPHDGAQHDKVYDVSYESAIRSAGFEVTVVPNQGRGAAMTRIEAGRRLFPMMWFNEATTEPGRDALGWYHERRSDDVREVGLGPEHDWSSHCFHGETEVLTRYGTQRIMDLPASGEVLTRWGWKAYRNPRMTLANAPLVAVTFSDGLTVKCTPDHLFATASGWISAERLQPGLVIQSGLIRYPKAGMARFINYGQKINICLVALIRASGYCTEQFGLRRLGRSLRDAISTIETVIRLITPVLTLSAYRLTSISAWSGTKGIPTGIGISAIMRGAEPLSGTLVRRGALGIAGTQQKQRGGLSGSGRRGYVLAVARNLTPSFARALWCKFIAAVPVRLLRIASRSASTGGPPTIVRVKKLNETADVWDLTVPGIEEFSLSNGAIVHNSADAFGLLCVAYGGSGGRPKALVYPDMGFI